MTAVKQPFDETRVAEIIANGWGAEVAAVSAMIHFIFIIIIIIIITNNFFLNLLHDINSSVQPLYVRLGAISYSVFSDDTRVPERPPYFHSPIP